MNKLTNIFEDIWNYFYYGTGGADGAGGYYENLDFDKTPLFSLPLAILFLFIGSIIACIVMTYNKQSVGKIVRAISKKGANSRENAKTLDELELTRSYTVRNAVQRNITLRRFVKCIEEEDYIAKLTEAKQETNMDAESNGKKKKNEDEALPKYYIDAEHDRFYIPEELMIRAEIRYEKKGSGKITTIISIILLIGGLIAVLFFLPQILEMVNVIFGAFK